MKGTLLRLSPFFATISFVLGILGSFQCGAPICWAGEQKFADGDICRAAVGVIMGRDPKIIKITKVKDGIYYLSYLRPSDRTKWSLRCKIEGNQVIWASDESGRPGRWRTHPADEKISFEVIQNGNFLKIKQQFSDGSFTSKDFTRSDLKQ